MNEAKPKPWPELEEPAPMDVEELKAVLFALGSAYGRPYDSIPLRVLAPALGLTSPRQLQRWVNGETPVPPLAAKLLRMFHTQSKVW